MSMKTASKEGHKYAGEARVMTSLVSNNRLPIRPNAHSGESLRGYSCRLSAANGYPTYRWLYDLEPSLKKFTDETSFIEALMRLTGQTTIEKLRSSYIECESLKRYRSEGLRICPECLREGGYHQAIWENSFASICPHHKIKLIDACPECDKPFSWSDLCCDTMCTCGADSSITHQVESSSPLLYLNAKLWGAAGNKTPIVELPNVPDEAISSLSLEQLCKFFWIISSMGKAHQSMTRNRPNSVHEAVGELQVVASMLSDWPQNFHRHLESYRDAETGNFNGDGLREEFDKTYVKIYKNLKDDQFNFIRDAFEQFVGANWNGFVDSKHQKRISELAQQEYVDVKQAAKILKISNLRIQKLIRYGVINAVTRKRQICRDYNMIARKDLEQIKVDSISMVGRDELLTLLGITKNQFYVLVDSGYIKPITKPEENPLKEWLFDIRPIKKILEDISLAACEKKPDSGALSFKQVCQSHIKCKNILAKFIESVRCGNTIVNGIKAGRKFDLKSLYFSRTTIAEFISNYRKEQENGYSIPEVARRLSLKQEVTYHLINTGIIKHKAVVSLNRSLRIVTEDDIEDFQCTFVPLTELTKKYNKSPRKLQNELTNLNILPATGRPVDNCRQLFYLRSDLSNTEYHC